MKPSKTTERKNLMNNTKMRTWAFTVFTLLLSLLREIPFSAVAGDLSSIISNSTFEEMLPYRNDPRCHAVGFYTYDAFIEAAEAFPEFGNIGNDTIRKREIAAFFGQTSQETTGEWSTAPGPPYSWGYCYNAAVHRSDNCSISCIPPYQCASGKQYYGRGPMQLTGNCNYGQCGEAIGEPLLNYPDLVETDAVISFKTAIWFWMNTQPTKPSCHDVMTGNFSSSSADIAAGLLPGYGSCTKIITGGTDCGRGWSAYGNDRIGYYKRYCHMFGIDYGENLDCYNLTPYGNGLWNLTDTL